MTKLDILNKNIDKQAQTKLGIQYTQKMKRAALESMQEYADQQLILSGVSQQRERLNSFAEEYNYPHNSKIGCITEEDINSYLKDKTIL
jgi:hypothetical protein